VSSGSVAAAISGNLALNSGVLFIYIILTCI
jgi:hypothetical protein